MDQIAQPAKPGTRRNDLRRPVCVFLIAFGIVKIVELADWSRLHRDATAMLDLGTGAVTGLLLGAKAVELLLTVAAVFALVRRDYRLLLGALAGWTAEFALLAVMAAVHGDLPRLVEHGLFCVAFGGLLTMTYAMTPKAKKATEAPQPVAAPPIVIPETMEGPGSTLPGTPPKDRVVAPKALSAQTRMDLPVRKADATRQDLPVRGADATRQDIPVRPKTPKTPEDG